MTTGSESVRERMTGDIIDNLIKRGVKMAQQQAQQTAQENEVALDPETQKKLVEREVKMAADPDFALAEEAKMTAIERMRRNRERSSAPNPSPVASTQPTPPSEAEIKKRDLSEDVRMLAEKGVPPDVIRTYILAMGNTGGSAMPMGFDMGGFSTLINTLSNILRPQGNGADAEIKDALKRIADKEASSQVDAIKSLTESVKSMVDEVKALKSGTGSGDGKPKTGVKFVYLDKGAQVDKDEDGVVYITKTKFIETPAPNNQGPSLEEIKEKNRHDEWEAAHKETQDFHKQLVETGAKAIENLSEVGGHILAGGTTAPAAKREASKPGIKYFKCTKCGFDIPVTPGALQIQCPNPECRKIFVAEGTQPPPPAATPAPAVPTQAPPSAEETGDQPEAGESTE